LCLEHAQQVYPVTKERRNEAGLELYLEHAQQEYPVTKDRRNEVGLWLYLEHSPNKNTVSHRIEEMRRGSGCFVS